MDSKSISSNNNKIFDKKKAEFVLSTYWPFLSHYSRNNLMSILQNIHIMLGITCNLAMI